VYVHLSYERPADAVEWLSQVFGLQEMIRMDRGEGDLLLSMLAGPYGGMVVISGLTEDFKDWMRQRAPGFRDLDERPWPYLSHAISVHVPDVDKHYERSREESATVLAPPEDQPRGVRSYAVLDLEGHQWEFVQPLRAVEPETWGARRVPARSVAG
jgi:uncharacterized glyoxalase superfamily protein PhnB